MVNDPIRATSHENMYKRYRTCTDFMVRSYMEGMLKKDSFWGLQILDK